MTNRSPIVRTLLLALVLGSGFSAVWAMAVYWSALTAIEILEPRLPVRSVLVDIDRGPVLRVQSVDYQKTSLETLDGRRLPADKFRALGGAELKVPSKWPSRLWNWSQRVTVLAVDRPTKVYWYLVDDGEPAGSAFFVGFDAETAGVVGYLGNNGFRPDLPPANDRFPVDEKALAQRRTLSTRYGQSSVMFEYFGEGKSSETGLGYLLSGSRLLEFNLSARQTRTLGEFPHALSVGILENWPAKPKHREWAAAVRLADEVVVVDSQQNPPQRFVLPPEIRGRDVTFYQTGRAEAILVAQPAVYVLGQQGQDVLRVNAEGRILDRNELRWKGRWWNSGGNRAVVGTIMATAFPAPVPALGLLPIVHAPYRFANDDFAQAWMHGLLPAWPHLLPVFALGGVMAWLCYRRQRRLSLPWTRAWVAFVFLFGLPGLVGYLVHRRWPPLAPCENCHTVVPRDRAACARCGNQFPPRAATGKEIFAA